MTALKKNSFRCPHCGAEAINGDDHCKVCGRAMVPPAAPARGVKGLVRSGLHALKGKVRPLTAEELDETLISADYSNPANPIWDD